MQNISCEIIEDLLPLYHDGVCSEESRKLVLSHTQTCDRCRKELQILDFPIDRKSEDRELDTVAAASKAWKKNKRKAFRTGFILVLSLAVVVAALFLGSHYANTSATADTAGLVKQLENYVEIDNIESVQMAQKGEYLAISGSNEESLWYVGIYERDSVFSDRWKICGSMEKVKAGKLANWNYGTPEGDTILVSFGAALSDDIEGYTFTNSGVTYTCPVKDNRVLDFFFVPDAYDGRTHLEPIYRP